MNLENYFQFLKMFAIGNSACPLGKNNSYSGFKQLKDASCYDVDDQCVKGDEAGHGVLYEWKSWLFKKYVIGDVLFV